MKKEYIKPEMVVEEFLIDEQLMMVTSNQDVEKDEADDFAPGRQDRRGRWGNLWSQD